VQHLSIGVYAFFFKDLIHILMHFISGIWSRTEFVERVRRETNKQSVNLITSWQESVSPVALSREHNRAFHQMSRLPAPQAKQGEKSL
jgi:hypothetical protein